MKTSFPKPAQTPTWYIVDAENQILGRLSTKVANVLRGRHRASYVPHYPAKDHVIILNASKVKVTGDKIEQKIYYRHTGYLGHLRETTLKRMNEKDPTKALKLAIKGMLPKNATRDHTLKQLHIYAGAEHEHDANKPVPLPLS
ncbi:50S ribosomal protein L13 [Candidatus Peribacteria bacterium]|nr:50S ribosomal protein L13 [Candidatus Peribacteria bacterium]